MGVFEFEREWSGEEMRMERTKMGVDLCVYSCTGFREVEWWAIDMYMFGNIYAIFIMQQKKKKSHAIIC